MSFKQLPTILLFICITLTALNCKKESPVAPLTSGPDTTSHNFTWTQYTFGGNGGSSYFKDVAIVNDSDIWAVGIIYSDSSIYNAAHWDGNQWKLIAVFDTDNQFIYSIRAIFIFGTNNIWLTDGGIHNWNGSSRQTSASFSRISLIGGTENGQSVDKLWGMSPNNIIGVGQKGMIAQYNGIIWTKLSSGTTIDLHDVWGTADGSEVWACGYSNDLSQSTLLQYNGALWKTTWLQQGTSTPPYEDLVLTQWSSDKFLYVGSATGIYLTPLSGNDSTRRVVILTSVPHLIRGSANNNIAVATDYKSIWHYNGSTWFEETPDELLKPLYSIAVSENTIVAVGFDATGLNWMGEISLGKRN